MTVGPATEEVDYANVGGPKGRRSVTEGTVDVDGTASYVFCSIPIRNIGPGIALIGEPHPRAHSVPDKLWTDGESTRPQIPVGETARLNFPLRGLRDELYVEVSVTDLEGNQRIRVRLYFEREADDRGQSTYVHRGTAWYDGESDTRLNVTGDVRVLTPSAHA